MRPGEVVRDLAGRAEPGDGDLLVGVTEQFESDDPERGFAESQTVYRSADRGATWEGPFRVPNPSALTVNGEKWRLNEGDFAEMDDGRILLYMREDGERLSAWKSISPWSGGQRQSSSLWMISSGVLMFST